MNSYLFYDIETTGLNIAFDQILQFSAIRTDMMLNEIERHTIKVQLRPDVIFSPLAMIINRISIADSMQGICEFEAVRQIHELLNKPGTISFGYNTLGFDDDILRFSFHRNLLPPYTHQYKNGCYRMDLLPITVLYRLYKKEILDWPDIDGKPSLKLEHLSSANQLSTGPAHDALVDVKATVALARKFFQEQKMWKYLCGYFNKETDRSRIKTLPTAFQSPSGAHRNGLMVGSEFGPEQNYQVPVLSMGRSIPYQNQTLWLRLDLPEVRETTSETIPDTTWVIRKRYGEPAVVLPPRERFLKYLNRERSETVEKNTRWLQENIGIFQETIRYHREYAYPEIPDLDVDAALYQIGFLSRQEQELCRRFHAAKLTEKVKLISRFSDAATRRLAGRVLCRNYTIGLPAEIKSEYQNYLQHVNPRSEEDAMLDYKGGRRTTPSGAMIEINRLRNEIVLGEEQRELLDNLENYIRKTFQKEA
ncbi:exonuclease domain-containing protein [Thermodesulfobacteriota bacterium]